MEDGELFGVDYRGGAGHRVASGLRLREGDHLADVTLAEEDGQHAVDAGADAGVRRRTVLERLQHVPELALCLLRANAEQAEHLLLHLAAVDTDAAAEQLPAVADEVVGVGANPAGVGVHERDVLDVRRGEWVVRRLPAALGLTPFEERVVGDEGEGQRLRIGQLEPRGDLTT